MSPPDGLFPACIVLEAEKEVPGQEGIVALAEASGDTKRGRSTAGTSAKIARMAGTPVLR